MIYSELKHHYRLTYKLSWKFIMETIVSRNVQNETLLKICVQIYIQYNIASFINQILNDTFQFFSVKWLCDISVVPLAF